MACFGKYHYSLLSSIFTKIFFYALRVGIQSSFNFITFVDLNMQTITQKINFISATSELINKQFSHNGLHIISICVNHNQLKTLPVSYVPGFQPITK